MRRRHDLPAGARVLSVLDEQGPLTVTQLAAAYSCSQPTMTGLVNQLLEQALATKEPHPTDTRAALVVPTAAGTAELVRVRRLNGEAISDQLARHPTLTHRGPAHGGHGPARAPLHRRDQGRPVTSSSEGFFRQPRAVWAVAFACVIAFMGIGLVDPILKPIADQLDATPSQVSLLFTSYMAVMGVAMLVTGVVSTRIGAKRTLMLGLGLIIVFSALAGLSDSHRRDRRLPGRLGTRQRPVHRHRPRDDRVVGPRLDRAGDHPVRGRAGPRHRRRPAARRRCSARSPGGRRSSASGCPDGDRAGGHRPSSSRRRLPSGGARRSPTRSARCATRRC